MSEIQLEVLVGEALKEKKWTVATAESCTGGLVMHRLTNVNGSSGYVQGGLVAYSYEAKTTLLKVKSETLLNHGAVSEETAIEMVRGVIDLLNVDCAVSITGIAGPGGGTEGKPVGLTYLAGATRTGGLISRHFIWGGDREMNKAYSAEAALQILLDLTKL